MRGAGIRGKSDRRKRHDQRIRTGHRRALTNIDGLIGSQFDDTLTGGAGKQIFRGLGGADSITGGADNDTADYSDDAGGVIVNLSDSTVFTVSSQRALDGFGATDTLSEIENVVGSAFNDTLVGSDAVNSLEGGAGDDLFIGGDGTDFISGGEGSDTVSYEGTLVGVRVLLMAGQIDDNTPHPPDNFALVFDNIVDGSVENVIGSDANDTMLGDDKDNLLEGRGGDDSLVGNGGNDTLDGGTNGFNGDTMVGGAGNDTYIVDHFADAQNIVELAGEG